jgi:O-antigen/teichoic acid export membrane protein
VLRAMTPFIVLQGIGPLLAVSVNYLGEARRRVPIALAALAVNVAIDVALLREIGVVAGAIGTSVAWLIYVGGHAVICHRLLDIRPRALAVTLARSLLAAAAMAGVLLAFGTGDVPVALLVAGLVAGTAVYAAVLFATRELTRADLALVRALRR